MTQQTGFKLAIVLVTAGLCVIIVLASRSSTAPALDVRDFFDPATLTGTTIDEATALKLFPCLTARQTQRHQFDPVTGVTLVPNQDVHHHWDEHPAGELRLATNAQGFREDRDTPTQKTGYRILVTGDSHTEGFVWNEQTIPNVLEELLDEEPGGPYEVINAGIGATCAWHHLGVLEKDLALEPDMFIAIVFTGNDFSGALTVSDYLSKRKRRAYPEGYEERLATTLDELGMTATRWGRSIVGNGFQQAYRFKHFPEEQDIALAAEVGWFEEMTRICEEQGIEFVTAVVPTKPEADPRHDVDFAAAVLASLDMTAEDYAVNQRLGDRFVAAMRERGIPVVDTTAVLNRKAGPFYWKKDYHLAVSGCRLVAEQLAAAIRPLLEP